MRDFFIRLKGLWVVAVFVFALAVAVPRPAYAQCDGPGNSIIAVLQYVADVLEYLADWLDEIITFLTDLISFDTLALDLRFFEFDFNTRNYFASLWQKQMRPALQAMTRQIHTAMIDQERMRGSYHDADKMSETLRRLQQEELASMRRNQPSETNCVSGTLAGGLAAGRAVGEALMVAIEKEEMERALGFEGTDAENGPVPDLATKFELYRNKFCSTKHNRGNAACEADGPVVDHDILTGEKFVNELTIDFPNRDIRDGAMALMRNMVTPNVNTPVPPEVLKSPRGPQSILNRRYREARRDVSRNIVSKIAAQRTPGTRMGPYINDIISSVGYAPSEYLGDNPSFNAVMYARTKLLLLHPQYFATFMDGPDAVEKEQLSLKSFSLMQDRERFKLLQDQRLLLGTELATKVDETMIGAGKATAFDEPVK